MTTTTRSSSSTVPLPTIAQLRIVSPLLITCVLIIAIARLFPSDATRVQASPLAQSYLIATVTPALPTPAPGGDPALAAPTPSQPPHLVTAYAAPLGSVLGPIDLSEGVQPVGRYGDAWIQLQRADSSRVWVALASAPELQALAAQQPDAMPPVQPAPIAAQNDDSNLSNDQYVALARAQYTAGQSTAPITNDHAADAALYATLPTAGPMRQAPTRKVCTAAQLRAPRGANCELPK